MSERPVEELRLHLGANASPDVVLDVARLFQAVHHALGGGGEFTVTIDNLNMKAKLRAWDSAAAERLHTVFAALEDPYQLDDDVMLHEVAAAIGRHAAPLQDLGGTFLKMHGRKPLRRLDASLVKVLRLVGSPAAAAPKGVRGRTEFRTPVLRVGRKAEAAAMQARLVVNGSPIDVDLHPRADVKSLFDAAERGGTHVVDAHVVWETKADGCMEVIPRSVRAISATPRALPATGAEFMQRLSISKETFDLVRDFEEQDD